jgi:hypothetical protein
MILALKSSEFACHLAEMLHSVRRGAMWKGSGKIVSLPASIACIDWLTHQVPSTKTVETSLEFLRFNFL